MDKSFSVTVREQTGKLFTEDKLYLVYDINKQENTLLLANDVGRFFWIATNSCRLVGEKEVRTEEEMTKLLDRIEGLPVEYENLRQAARRIIDVLNVLGGKVIYEMGGEPLMGAYLGLVNALMAKHAQGGRG